MPGRIQTLEAETTWGTIRVELLGGRIVRCSLPFLTDQPDLPFAAEEAGADPASRFVAAILTGKSMKVPTLGELGGTGFQQEVWRAIVRIPFGETQTYGELARTIGRPKAYRAVANACGKNPLPLFVPCHRVVAASGKIGGFSAGLPWKRLLLASEGWKPDRLGCILQPGE